jgi:3-oxoacyl-[acyl-carrier protein] reductase
MDLGLAGRRALITAASKGLGLACADRLAREGCAVAISARGGADLEQARIKLARHGRTVAALEADLGSGEDIERMFAAAKLSLGGLDILIFNTGHLPYGGLEQLSDVDLFGAFDITILAATRLVRLALPEMRKSGAGAIVFINSSTTREPSPHLLSSNVMRAGVAGLAKTLSRSLASEAIRVNVAAPGYFDSGRVAQRIRETAESNAIGAAAAMREIAGDVPLGRIGAPSELADLVAFLASPRAAFITGATVTADGGASHSLF